jgi:membrane protease YdiL (CAAX protease family)
MDRRLTVILAICLMEATFRSLSGYVPADVLVYTLAVRLIQMAVILGFSFQLCGIIPAKLGKELTIGLAASCIFGALVLLADLSSRLIVHGGLLPLLVTRQRVDSPLLFLLAGCLIGPFVEELFFRGLLYSWMRERIPALPSIIITSLLFASLHGQLSPVQFIGGLLFASIYEWRKNIWAPFVVHALGNLGIWIVPSIYPLM